MPQPYRAAPSTMGDQNQCDGKGAETDGAARKLEHRSDGGKESASCEILCGFFHMTFRCRRSAGADAAHFF